MGMFDFPRELTWPGGFAVLLLVMAVIFTPFRRRSQLLQAAANQFYVGTVVMLLITGMIMVMLPAWEQLPKH